MHMIEWLERVFHPERSIMIMDKCWICEQYQTDDNLFQYVGVLICSSCLDVIETVNDSVLKEVMENERRSSSTNRVVRPQRSD